MQRYISKITDEHMNFVASVIRERLGAAATEEEVNQALYETLSKMYAKSYQPLLVKRYMSGVPHLNEANMSLKEVYYDIKSINAEHENIATYIVDDFNTRQNQKNKLINKVKSLSTAVDDAMFLNKQLDNNVVVMKDSFNNNDLIDVSKTSGSIAYVATKEGVAKLNVTGAVDLAAKSEVVSVEGNGELGSSRLVVVGEKVNGVNQIQYESSITSAKQNIIDSSPTTLFEYSMVGFSEEDKDKVNRYDILWAKAKKEDDLLRARILIKLQDTSVINAITLSPFFRPGQNPRLKVLSIRVSNDGIQFQPILQAPVVINPLLNQNPDTFLAEDKFMQSISTKLAGNGVFIIEPTEAKFVEFVLEQDQPYSTKIGHTYYIKAPFSDGDKMDLTKGVRLKEAEVPKEIADGDFGRYFDRDSGTAIEKGIEVIDGWRYSIGIKDIGIYQYTYEQRSELVSVKYSTGNNGDGNTIKKIYVEADEFVPAELRKSIANRNTFVKYYISFDDVNWTRVSPKHHMPHGTEQLPPKIIEINPIENAVNANKYAHKSTTDVDKFRIKVVFERPGDLPLYTPVLEEYRVFVELGQYQAKGE